MDVLTEDQASSVPLSARMRPRTLEEYVGQEHILGDGTLLSRAIAADRLSSLILYGPPGCGKTTLAQCIQQKTKTTFERLNAITSNVEEMRKILAAAQHRRRTTGQRTLLFIDEIHRFNKAQQDVLMPDLEEGNVILIGATVFNPFFSLTGPLLSRSMVFELQALSKESILKLLQRALSDDERGLGRFNIQADLDALEFLASVADGDARKALNALELGCLTTATGTEGRTRFTISEAQESIQKRQVLYDRDGDGDYDTISAFIKSMRGSDPNATLYCLAKMIYAGEDPRFIARRICICAAEDVGNADPRALTLANSAAQVAELVGLPEARIPLAQAAVYIACAPKSNAVYLGIDAALEEVKNRQTRPVPAALRSTGYSGAKKLGRGQEYKYPHDFPGHYVDQEYMPDPKIFYHPTEQGFEKTLKSLMIQLKKNSERSK